MARFLGKEEAIVFNMGYETNATTIPALCSPVRGFTSRPMLLLSSSQHSSLAYFTIICCLMHDERIKFFGRKSGIRHAQAGIIAKQPQSTDKVANPRC